MDEEAEVIIPSPDTVAVLQRDENLFATLDWQKQNFLDVYTETCSVSAGVKAAKVAHSTIYYWLNNDAYRQCYAVAKQIVADKLEDALADRAIKGREEAIYYKGEFVANKYVPSDLASIFMLKGLRPDKYRERQTVDIVTHLRTVAEQEGLDANELMNEVQRLSKGMG